MKLGTLLLIIIIGAAVAGLILFLGYLGYNAPLPFNDWYTTAAGYIGNFDLSTMLSNPAALIAGIGGAAAIAVPLYTTFSSKISAAKQQLTKITSDSAGAIDKLTGEKTTLQQQVDKLTAENQKLNETVSSTKNAVATAQSNSEAKLVELQNLNTNLNQQKQELEKNLHDLQLQFDTLYKVKAVP